MCVGTLCIDVYGGKRKRLLTAQVFSWFLGILLSVSISINCLRFLAKSSVLKEPFFRLAIPFCI